MAVSTLETGPSAAGPGLRARVRALLRRPAPELPAFIHEQIDREVACNQLDLETSRIHSQMDGLLARVEEYAADEKLSQRKLAIRLGFSWSTWGRLRGGQVNPAAWLPVLRQRVAALEGGPA